MGRERERELRETHKRNWRDIESKREVKFETLAWRV